MFVELLPILRNRPLMLTLALVGDKAIQVNVIPKRLKEGDSGDNALTTPLTVTGTPDELDREFASQLVGFSDAFVRLGSNLSDIEAAHASAVKAVEAERKKEIESKRKGAISKPASTTAETKPGPVVKDGKPVFGTKTGTAETANLFDSHLAAAPTESVREQADSTQQAIGTSPVESPESICKSNGEVKAASQLPGFGGEEEGGGGL
jgi:PRTRC genetic system protein E